jgi:hypothetical protein
MVIKCYKIADLHHQDRIVEALFFFFFDMST